ncbi:MAG: 2Fe-2S iron-sulfur cluster-binding protein [Alphaproteobacteria bacterium]|nr:2Fe-2S iron-sulfur cluster-binding protein [Alphaproteobacteria bacterium]
MPRLTFIEPDGTRRSVDADNGLSIMETALKNGIKGILGECGGTCCCSTCHCYVPADWIDRLPPKSEDEADLLDFAWEPKETSRLTCQITVADEIDGLVLQVPEEQLS